MINKKVLARWLNYPLFDGEYNANGLAHSIELRNNIYALISGKFKIVNRYGSDLPNFKGSFMYLKHEVPDGRVFFYQVHPWQVRPVLRNGWIKI